VAVVTETFEVNGIRCERCVNRLRAALVSQDGLEAATANLMGQVTLQWDEERTSRQTLVAALEGAGFRRREPVAE
jgi:copper chaperone CopZ